MNYRRASTFALAVCLSTLVLGCQNSANQPSAADANTPAGTDAKSSPSMAESANSAVKRALEPKPLVVPADTALSVVLDQSVSSKTSNPGDKFLATIESPVEVNGKVAIPKGTHAEGIVKDAKAAGRFKGGAVLELALTTVTVHGKDYEIHTSAPTMTSKGKGKRTAVMVGGGAAGGAAIGAAAGGGKGAAIGALIGAAAGTGGAGLTGNRDITLAAETALEFKLTEPVRIKEK